MPFIRRVCDTVLEAVYPSKARCLGCGDLTGADDGWLCEPCAMLLKEIDLLPLPCCERCGAPLRAGRPCSRCRRWPDDGCRRAAYRYLYAAPVSGLVRSMKYKGVYRMADWMSAQIAELLAGRDGYSFDCVVPVPMHPARLRDRGHNSAEAIASRLAQRVGMPCVDALRRTRNTKQQAKLPYEQRMRALEGVFAVRDPSSLVGRRVLLVDDVITTGTTVNRCAAVLFAAGARDVQAVAFSGHGDQEPWDDTDIADLYSFHKFAIHVKTIPEKVKGSL